MNIEIKDSKKCEQFVQMFQYIKLFSLHVNISFKLDNFFIQGMDSSHISVFEILLNKEWFENYEIETEQVIGINTNILFKILNIRSEGQGISLIIKEDNMDIELKGENKGEFDKYFTMPLVDIDYTELTIPDSDVNLIFSMDSKKFKMLIDQFSNFGEDLTFMYENNELTVSSNNDTEGSMKININIDDMESCEVEDDLEFESSYNLKNLLNMAQFYKITSDVYLYISLEQPFQILYKLDDVNYVRFFLAPKV